jgi:C-terminal processing protease CtpA/Prc
LSLADATPDLRRYLGAPDGAGVLVTGIAPGRPAAADGLRVGDILVQVGDRPVREVGDVERLLLAPGDGVVEVSLVRARREEVVTMSPRRPPAPSGSRRAAEAREDRPDARVLSERVLRSEIERLQRRIDRLKRQLEARESDPD